MDYLEELTHCELCEHRCGVNRFKGEMGVCRMTFPVIASATLHPAPPESYTIFTAGCNFKCLNCQNWSISQYPDNGMVMRGVEETEALAKESICHLQSDMGQRMGADRIFFSGGEPTIHLPFIERVVKAARQIDPSVKVNFDTNGFMTEDSLKRVLSFTTSITFDIKAFDDEVHRALTGAPVSPVLRNAHYVGTNAKDQLWEYRVLVIPQVNEGDIRPLAKFVASIDPFLPVRFLAFRPNFVLEECPGASSDLMRRCTETATEEGLKNVSWSGRTDLPGRKVHIDMRTSGKYQNVGAMHLATYALRAGCETHPRDCRICRANIKCRIKRYIPRIST